LFWYGWICLIKIKLFIEEEIWKICASLENNKSTGLDHVSYKHLKYRSHLLQKYMCAPPWTSFTLNLFGGTP
jgi:hypothetical protein